jgi:archaellum component FlaC
MTIRPGILSLGESGKIIYIDTPENILALIRTGTFDNEVLFRLKNDGFNDLPKKISLQVSIPKKSETIKVAYDTKNIKSGTTTLYYLLDALSEKYEKLVTYFRKTKDMELEIINNTIHNLKIQTDSEKKNIGNIDSRITELKNEIKSIIENTKKLSQERHKFISGNTQEDNILQALLYSNTIQQNLTLTNTYKGEINTFFQKRENILQKISDLEKKISDAMIKKKNIAFNKDIINNIQLIQEPTSGPNPIKPRVKLNILLSIIAAVFFMIVTAFLIEYFRKHGRRITSKQ